MKSHWRVGGKTETSKETQSFPFAVRQEYLGNSKAGEEKSPGLAHDCNVICLMITRQFFNDIQNAPQIKMGWLSGLIQRIFLSRGVFIYLFLQPHLIVFLLPHIDVQRTSFFSAPSHTPHLPARVVTVDQTRRALVL